MSGMLFGRVTEVIVSDRNFSGNDFTIDFDIPFDDEAEANIAEVKIYNLSNETITRLIKGEKIIINAGYSGDTGTILAGLVYLPKSVWSGVDRITTLQCLDGTDSWFSMAVKKSYNPGTTGKLILEDLLGMTGLQIGAFALPVNHVYRSGKTIKGKLKDAIKEIAKACGAKAHVTRGKVFIRPKDEGDNIGFILNADSGLVGSPTPLEKEVETGKKDADGNAEKVKRRGWAVRTLLNHRITTDALLQITSRTANGVFRVESGKHTGQGAGGAYYTEMEVFPV